MVADTIKAFDLAQSIMQNGYGTNRGLTKNLTPSGVGNLLASGAFRSIYWRHFDFGDATIVTSPFTITKDAGATTFSESTSATSGALTCSTGTTGNDGISLHLPGIFKGDLDCTILIRHQFDVITNSANEVGFIDANSDKTTLVISDIDTPTVAGGAADLALLARETGETLDGYYGLATKGSTPYTAATTTLYRPGSYVTDTVTVGPTAAVYQTLMVSLNGDNVHAMIFDANEIPVAYAYKASGIEGGTALLPWWALITKNTTAKVPLIDYITVFQNRV